MKLNIRFSKIHLHWQVTSQSFCNLPEGVFIFSWMSVWNCWTKYGLLFCLAALFWVCTQIFCVLAFSIWSFSTWIHLKINQFNVQVLFLNLCLHANSFFPTFPDYPNCTCVSFASVTWRAAASSTSTWGSVTGSIRLLTRSTGRMKSLCLRWGAG